MPLFTDKQYTKRISAAMAGYYAACNRLAHLVETEVLRNKLLSQINQFFIRRAVRDKASRFIVLRILLL